LLIFTEGFAVPDLLGPVAFSVVDRFVIQKAANMDGFLATLRIGDLDGEQSTVEVD